MKKIFTLCVILITCSSCSEFALLASGTSVAVSQNAYAKAYSGMDVLTIVQTEKDIKTHIYDQVRRLDKTKRKETNQP
jgi:DNA-binding transcriptional regulator YhcF (GntR family)